MLNSAHMVAIAIAALVLTPFHLGAGLGWWLAAAAAYFSMACLGVTVTFHRYLTHGSFQFRHRRMERLFTLFGHLAATGSPLVWVSVHRQHHILSDHETDVHGPKRGLKNFIPDYDGRVRYAYVRDMLKDPFHVFVHERGGLVIVAYYVILLALGGHEAFYFLGILPQALTGFVSALCNWFGHSSGYRTYDTPDDSRNCWWLALPTFGDSWHNNHHAKPGMASFGRRWWEIDLSAYTIKLIAKKGTIQ